MEDPTESVSRRLRLDTAEIHARVEQVMDLLGHLSQETGYRETLLGMEAFYRTIEPSLALAASGRVAPMFLESRRERLVADLDALDPAWKPAAAVGLPDQLSRWPQALGGLYVLEGAALGGQVIARHLRESLGVTSSFFGNEGAPVGKRWKEFRELLDQHPDEYTAIYEGAVTCFGAFERAIVKQEVSVG